MTPINNYLGLDIFIHNDGMFYCCFDNFSRNYKDATIKSESLNKIIKGIDTLFLNLVPTDVIYIDMYNFTLSEAKVVRVAGKTFSKNSDGKYNYFPHSYFYKKEEIEKTDSYKDFVKNIEELNKLKKEIEKIQNKSKKISSQNYKLIESFKQFKF